MKQTATANCRAQKLFIFIPRCSCWHSFLQAINHLLNRARFNQVQQQEPHIVVCIIRRCQRRRRWNNPRNTTFRRMRILISVFVVVVVGSLQNLSNPCSLGWLQSEHFHHYEPVLKRIGCDIKIIIYKTLPLMITLMKIKEPNISQHDRYNSSCLCKIRWTFPEVKEPHFVGCKFLNRNTFIDMVLRFISNEILTSWLSFQFTMLPTTYFEIYLDVTTAKITVVIFIFCQQWKKLSK